MSTLGHPAKPTCALCGHQSEQKRYASASSHGSELDGRPLGSYRDTMDSWAQQCANPACGYCTANIEEELPGARECVGSDDYRAKLASTAMRPLTRKFYLAALVALCAGDAEVACTYFIFSAWDCDDGGMAPEARAYRLLAANLFRHGSPVTYVDLLRRAGEFQQATTMLDRIASGGTLAAELTEDELKLLEFERKLVLAGDAAAHTTGELTTP